MSEIGEDVFTAKPQSSGLQQTLKRDKAVVRVPTANAHDERLYQFDISATTADLKQWSATKADRMTAEEAGAKLRNVFIAYRIQSQDPQFLRGFVDSLLFTLAVNSSSGLTPGRAEFVVAGTEFKLLDVIKYLNADLRRWFRAYADATVAVLKGILEDPNIFDPHISDKKSLIQSVAMDRGLSRYMHLIGDNAEACTGLSPVEYVAVAKAKTAKLMDNINVADRLKTASSSRSYGAFDSSNGEFLDTSVKE